MTLIMKFHCLKLQRIPGCLVNNVENNKGIILNTCKDHIHVGENIGTLDDLNEIPSPYLNGMLDEFFEDRWMPVLEQSLCPFKICIYICESWTSVA